MTQSPAAPTPPDTSAVDWIDCGRYAWSELEQSAPHWVTLPGPPSTGAHPAPGAAQHLRQVQIGEDALAATVAKLAQAAAAETVDLKPPSESVSGNPALAAAMHESSELPSAPRLREIDLERFLHRLENRLNDPLTARPTVRLTDRLSAGFSSRHTAVDDTPEPRRPWPLLPVRAPEELERLLAVHDAAWTAFEKAGNALGLRFELPPGSTDCFHWIPAVERFFQRHATLPILVDGMGPVEVKGWDQLIKAGADLQVYGLARGVPGLDEDRRAAPVESLTPAELRRADAILHFYVGEVGAERVLFGSGLGRRHPADAGLIYALAQWFARERPWLEADSARYILFKNARRLARV